MKLVRLIPVLVLAGICYLVLGGCGGGSRPSITVAISPTGTQTVDSGQSLLFTASASNDIYNRGVAWAVSGTDCLQNTCGILSNVTAGSAIYTAPAGLTTSMTVSLSVAAISNIKVTQSVSITVEVVPMITNTVPLANGQNGAPYSQTITATGGVPPLNFSIISGQLPPGLFLNSSGVIQGTPSGTASTNNFTVQVADSGIPALTASLNFAIIIAPPTPLAISTVSLPEAPIGTIYNTSLGVSPGGMPPLTWSLALNNVLPNGLTLNPSTGQISGTATTAGTTTFTVQVTDSAIPPQHSIKSLGITAGAPLPLSITTASLPDGTTAMPYATGVVTSGGLAPLTWTVTSGQLPAGLSINPGDGVIAGTPIRVESSDNVTIQVTDSNTPPAVISKTLNITIDPNINAGTPDYTLLNGTYAFFFDGFSSVGETVIAGQFTASGSGTISSGTEDINFLTSETFESGIAFSGTYILDNNGRGMMQLTIRGGGGTTSNPEYLFTLNSDGSARFIEVDTPTNQPPGLFGTGLRGAGIIKPETTTSFGNSDLSGNYAFGFGGVDLNFHRTVVAGTFNADGGGGWTGQADANDEGVMSSYPISATASTYSVTTSGRGAGHFFLGGTSEVDFVFYMVSPSDIFFLSSDTFVTVSGQTIFAPFAVSGEAFSQQPPATSLVFNATALAGSMVASGQALDGSNSSTFVGLLTANSSGGISSFSYDQNDAGKIVSAATPVTGSYSVSPLTQQNGRVVFTGLGNLIGVGYLIAQNSAVFIGTDAAATLGLLEPQQTLPSFSNPAFQGSYVLNYGFPHETNVSNLEGVIQADGLGDASGPLDFVTFANSTETVNQAQTLTASYTTGSNGRGTLNVSAPTGVTTTWTFYIVSPSEIRAVSAVASDTHPALLFLNH